MLAQSVYVMVAVAGTAGLVWKVKLADVALQQAAPIGAWMTVIALVTGALWGKPTWGTYWVWAARLTSMQIGRASCRARVCQYVSIAVVAVYLQKKKK